MKRKTFGIDLDDTLNNLCDVWLEHYNRDYKENLKKEDIKSWNIASYTKIGDRIYDYLLYPNFFQSLGIQPQAKEVTEWLSQYFELYIVTAYHPATCYDKSKWVEKNLPHIPSRNIIFCNNKGLVHTDFLLDDGLHNIEAYKKNNPRGFPIVFTQPWNLNVAEHYVRADNWEDVQNIVLDAMYEFHL